MPAAPQRVPADADAPLTSVLDLVETITRLRRVVREAPERQGELDALYRALLSRHPPPDAPPPRNPLEAARELADVWVVDVPPSHRRRFGAVITRSKRALLRGIGPLHRALLAPQRSFNLALAALLCDLVEGGVDRSASIARVHALRHEFPEGRLRALLRTAGPFIGPILTRQQSWNRRALELAEIAASGERPGVDEANRLIAGLAGLCDPVGAPAPGRLSRALSPVWREVFRRQNRFNTEVMLALSNLLHGRPPVVAPTQSDYRAWYEEREPAEIEATRRALRDLKARPLISIVVPAWETPPDILRACIDSVRAQLYDRWELCVVDDGSRSRQVAKVLEDASRRDPRIRWSRLPQNAGIARATNAAIEMARGEWIAFLDHDDLLAPHALARVALRLSEAPEVDWLYTDEDRITLDGRRHDPMFKPDWSPELLRSVNYVCHFVVARADLVRRLRLREGFEGSQDYDFLLRLSEITQRVAHLPQVLYHWRSSSLSLSRDDQKLQAASAAGRRALEEHLSRSGVDGATVREVDAGHYQVRYPVRGRPLVSIIVPFRDRPDLLERLVPSLLARTRYTHYELILVSNNSTQPATFALLDTLADPRIRKLTWDHPFNYPAINNFAVREARGDLLLFLNNDMEIADPDWLDELIGHAQRPEVGAVGPKLLFPDGSIQHAGIVVGLCEYAAHPFWRFPNTRHHTPFGHADWNRNYLAVTSACVMLRREVFEALGGFDERFRVCGSDVDLGLRVVGMGLQVVYTAGTWLYHHESASRRNDAIPEDDQWESVVAYRRWLEAGDPFYNPNLSLRTTDCDLRRDAASAVEIALKPLVRFASDHLRATG